MSFEGKLMWEGLFFALIVSHFFPFLGALMLWMVIEIWEEIVEEFFEEFLFEGYVEWPEYVPSLKRFNYFYFKNMNILLMNILIKN